jgi:hypothetical protein
MNDSKLKLDNSKSRFHKKNDDTKANKAKFESEISEHQSEQSVIVKKIIDLTSQFVGFIKDKTLNENKGPIQLGLEKSIPKELSEISLEIDNDETTNQICLGSNGLILLLLRTSLIQRDIINELAYKVSNLETRISSSSNQPNDK